MTQKIHVLNAENKVLALRRELLSFNDDMRVLCKDYSPDMSEANMHDCIGTLEVNLRDLKRRLVETEQAVERALKLVRY